MIRPFTLIAAMLAAGSGAYLFAVKHRAQMLDDQLASVAQQSRADEQRIRVLQAQWALEIDPTRLNQLAARFTSLQPMKPAQLITLASLQMILPPAGSSVPGANPESDAPVMPMATPDAAGANAPVAMATPGLPLPPEAPPLLLASAEMPAPVNAPRAESNGGAAGTSGGLTPRVKSALRAAHAQSHSSLHMASSSRVAALPPPKPLYTASALPAPHPLYAAATSPRTANPGLSAGRSVPMGAQVMSVKAVATPVAAAPASSTMGGSVLGMANNLPPPQPYSGGSGN